MVFCSFALAESDWDAAQKTQALRFAVEAAFPPFNFVNEKNELTGFDVELCKEIAKRLGLKPLPVAVVWDGIVAGLLARKYEMVCSSLAITEARKKSVDFSKPYYRSGAQLFVKKGSELKSLDQLQGKKLGVTLGTTYETWVREHYPKIELLTYRGDPEVMLDVVNGRISGFVSDKFVGLFALHKQNVPIQIAGPLLYEEHLGLAFRKGSVLKERVDSLLDAIQKDGTYKKLSLQWVGVDIQ